MTEKRDSDQKKLKREHSIQEYFYFAYVFLIILGITRQTIYFWFLDINILSYMNILDAILSPLAYMADHPIVLVTLIVCIIVMLYFVKWSRFIHFKYRDSNWYKKLYNVEKIDKAYEKEPSLDGLLFIGSLFVISFFLGSGIGSGYKTNQRLNEGKAKVDHVLTFSDYSKKRVSVLELNSQYIIYINEHAKHISITPISDHILVIEKIRANQHLDKAENIDPEKKDDIESLEKSDSLKTELK